LDQKWEPQQEYRVAKYNMGHSTYFCWKEKNRIVTWKREDNGRLSILKTVQRIAKGKR